MTLDISEKKKENQFMNKLFSKKYYAENIRFSKHFTT